MWHSSCPPSSLTRPRAFPLLDPPLEESGGWGEPIGGCTRSIFWRTCPEPSDKGLRVAKAARRAVTLSCKRVGQQEDTGAVEEVPFRGGCGVLTGEGVRDVPPLSMGTRCEVRVQGARGEGE